MLLSEHFLVSLHPNLISKLQNREDANRLLTHLYSMHLGLLGRVETLHFGLKAEPGLAKEDTGINFQWGSYQIDVFSYM